jgi:hypothetical protein
MNDETKPEAVFDGWIRQMVDDPGAPGRHRAVRSTHVAQSGSP